MSSSQRAAIWTSSRMWLIIAAIIALPLLAEFNARLSQSRELEAQQTVLVKQIDAEKAKHEALLKLQTWVKTDAYIEYWARSFGRMTKPGEVAVIATASQIQAPTSKASADLLPTATLEPASEWWTAFFGTAH
jgi:cell division protein FtsB